MKTLAIFPFKFGVIRIVCLVQPEKDKAFNNRNVSKVKKIMFSTNAYIFFEHYECPEFGQICLLHSCADCTLKRPQAGLPFSHPTYHQFWFYVFSPQYH